MTISTYCTMLLSLLRLPLSSNLICQVPFRHVLSPTYFICDSRYLTPHILVMNRIFCVAELVRQVAFNADDGSQGSTSLLALARCCKTIEGPVMDVLWQRQKSLNIILQTLPADCWTTTDKTHVSRTFLDLPSHSLSPHPAYSQNPYNE